MTSHTRLRKLVPRRYWRTEKLKRRLLQRCDQGVVAGPFAGMNYLATSVGSVFIPKLLGTYERELHSIVERLVARKPMTVLNAGAAEGYYGVGLSIRLPESRIVFWEASSRGRQLVSQLLHRNDIPSERVKVFGLCTATRLRDELAIAGENPLLIVDIEGGEAILLDPAIIPELRNCTILVEVHEFAVEGVEELLFERFAGTHEIERIVAETRVVEDWPQQLGDLIDTRFEGAAIALMSEGRPDGMAWLFMRPGTREAGQG